MKCYYEIELNRTLLSQLLQITLILTINLVVRKYQVKASDITGEGINEFVKANQRASADVNLRQVQSKLIL